MKLFRFIYTSLLVLLALVTAGCVVVLSLESDVIFISAALGNIAFWGTLLADSEGLKRLYWRLFVLMTIFAVCRFGPIWSITYDAMSQDERTYNAAEYEKRLAESPDGPLEDASLAPPTHTSSLLYSLSKKTPTSTLIEELTGDSPYPGAKILSFLMTFIGCIAPLFLFLIFKVTQRQRE